MDNRRYFNKLACSWDETSKPKAEKLKRIVELTDLDVSSKILDVGTGTGVIIPYLMEKEPSKIIGVDMSDGMISIARNKFDDERIEFLVGDMMTLEIDGFDCIMLHNVYPHINDKEKLFQKAYAILKEGGTMIVAHSSSRDKINGVHSVNVETKDDRLPTARVTASIMSNFLEVKEVIDEDIYFVKGVKNKFLSG